MTITEKKMVVLNVFLIAAFLGFAALTGGCATGESYAKTGYNFSAIDKVAVVDIAGDIKGNSAKNQIADFFGMELLKKGYSPIERAQVQSLLMEQEFQAMEVTGTAGAAQVGKILNVPIVLVANVDYGEKMTMTAKMIEVETGSIIWMGSGAGKTGKGLITIAGIVGGALGGGAAGSAVSDSSAGTVAGAVAGGILGGVAGEALTPQQAQQAQKVIKKICKSLPSKFGQP